VRTAIVILIGLFLSIATVFAANYAGKEKITGAVAFIALWFVFCAFDYANGVKAGYSAVEELGIHILLFTVPAISSWLAARFWP
jgi:hypothetical protein